ncbi:MAG: hypothetical protein K2Z81_19395, partial [Cyanobacteria bacterium]|nr:hypothetical protein [Cyanobacteriota bacterium]
MELETNKYKSFYITKMIYQIGLALFIAAFASASASASYYKEDPVHLKAMWESFKSQFGRSYETMDEETSRFQKFVTNLKTTDQRNKEERTNGGSGVHGITRFFDLSQAEFESRFLTAKPSSIRTAERALDTEVRTLDISAGLIDWTGKYTTAVKNQGYCGSCWAFSAAEQIESDAMRTLGKSWILSPEQITQCDKTSSGCGGGTMQHAYTYVKYAGGISTEEDYPYTSSDGTTGTCKADSSKYVVKVSGYTAVTGESNMASFVQKKGPLSVCVDASSFNTYTGGIMKTCGKTINHCVQAVGVDASTEGYWKVRNSWGPDWGEE